MIMPEQSMSQLDQYLWVPEFDHEQVLNSGLIIGEAHNWGLFNREALKTSTRRIVMHTNSSSRQFKSASIHFSNLLRLDFSRRT